MRYFSTRATSAHAIFLRVAFARAADSLLVKQGHMRDYVRQRSSSSVNLTDVVARTLCVDTAMVLVGWLVSMLSIRAMGTLAVPYQKIAVLLPPRWFVLASCLLLPCGWLATDLVKALTYPQTLPFAGLKTVLKKNYQQRFYLLLLAFCFAASVTLLCMVSIKTPLVLKLIVSAIFVLMFHAFSKRRRPYRFNLFATSMLLIGVLFINQAIATARLIVSFEGVVEVLHLIN